MAKNIVVFQTDNRDLDFITMTKLVNKRYSALLGYTYRYEHMNEKYYEQITPPCAKLFVVHNLIHNNPIDILIFLDTDAWIHSPFKLSVLIDKLIKSDKHGCLSRDPYLSNNTYINSGSFILKINDFTKKMYKDIIKDMQENTAYVNNWPFDQYYFSDYIYKNREKFFIFKPDVLNTPDGSIMRHNWFKNEQMYSDLVEILRDPADLLDSNEFPNKEESESIVDTKNE